MIIDLPDTNTSKIQRSLVKIREDGGVVALGRVLTLVIATDSSGVEEAIEAANDASREHPMRVIVISRDPDAAADQPSRLDAEIRVGGDAGASEVVVLRACGDAGTDEESLVTGLLLPDAPLVAWWPRAAPPVVAESPLGRIAQRRITDAAAQPFPQDAIRHLGATYAPGDTDFSWTRLTLWRAMLAAVLDQPPYEPVLEILVAGSAESPSTKLLAAWLAQRLQAPVRYTLAGPGSEQHGIQGVRLFRASGSIDLWRDVPAVATLKQPGQPTHQVSLPRRSLRDCLAEELRRLGPDDLYGQVLQTGLAALPEPSADAGG